MSEKVKLNYESFEVLMLFGAINKAHYLSSIVDYLDYSYFENGFVKSIFPIVVDFFKRRNACPKYSEIITLMSGDNGKEHVKEMLLRFKTIDPNINEEELFANTEQFLKEHAVLKAIRSCATKIQSDTLDANSVLPVFEAACNISLVDDLGFNYFSNIDKHCDDLKRVASVIPTGWKWLDERIGGGWAKDGRQLTVFVGRTNVGKSIVLGNVALNALKQNKKVLLITLEMPEILYAKRFSSQISQIPLGDIASNTDGLKPLLLDFKHLYPNAELFVKEFPPKALTVNHLNGYVKKLLQNGYKFDLIVVDYLNLLKSTDAEGNSYEKIKGIAEQLRATSYMFSVPVITASQLNRAGMTEENPGMETISESIGMSFTADIQISIWSTSNDRMAGLINIGIQKNRAGIVDECTSLKIDYKTLLISELTSTVAQINTPRTSTSESDEISIEDILSNGLGNE